MANQFPTDGWPRTAASVEKSHEGLLSPDSNIPAGQRQFEDKLAERADKEQSVGPSGFEVHAEAGYTPPHIKPSHKGLLHEKLGVPEGEKIPESKINEAEHSSSPALRKEANFAKVAKHWSHHPGAKTSSH